MATCLIPPLALTMFSREADSAPTFRPCRHDHPRPHFLRSKCLLFLGPADRYLPCLHIPRQIFWVFPRLDLRLRQWCATGIRELPVGIDPVDRCEALADVRFRPAEASIGRDATSPLVSIEICVASETEEEEADWTRLEEGGTSEMWFNHQALTLNMVPAAL
ncbi:hypothetical protein F5X68DRAFT_16431 [Plectosphaerella plurivora]|uniref:Uncharacterized protein n=1 Tax=Plectosphaerella plurivora TaxID=936078 RepID=A0A9P8VAP3_9PEZI|nr:hypothetical protein F5X68DRAFT_16431 [Plectosphaerella plurivora]